MKKGAILPVLILLLASLPGCTVMQKLSPEPTATFSPSQTSTPENTKPAPVITRTLRPTTTPKPDHEEGFKGDARIVLKQGGFSFQPPPGYEATHLLGRNAIVTDKEKKYLIALNGSIFDKDLSSADKVAAALVSTTTNYYLGRMAISASYPLPAAGREAIAYDISGQIGQKPVKGQAVIFELKDDQFIFIFGISYAVDKDEKNPWDGEGSQVFQDVLDSIEFLPGGQTAPGSCPISSDPTYGYSKENPIRVGGGTFDGPAREREYLDNLVGEKGEATAYDRLWSLSLGDSILDEYELFVGEKKIILYIDEYSFSTPQAPANLSCLSEFTLARP
jgi:hypothetical protein